MMMPCWCSNPECKATLEWPNSQGCLSIELRVHNVSLQCASCSHDLERGKMSLGYCGLECLKKHMESGEVDFLCQNLNKEKGIFDLEEENIE